MSGMLMLMDRVSGCLQWSSMTSRPVRVQIQVVIRLKSRPLVWVWRAHPLEGDLVGKEVGVVVREEVRLR